MKLFTKIILSGLVVLDVAHMDMCGLRIPPKKNNEYLFLGPNHSVAYRTKFVRLLNEPKVEVEGYELKCWYIYDKYSSTKTPVEFPYTYNEDDIISYYVGYRNVIIFEGEWEKIA